MKKLVFLVLLLSLSFAYSQHLVKPDTLWTFGPAKFTSYPAVHPNGNVLVRIGHDVHELNGLTGEFIRKIYIPSDAYSSERIEVSVDGTKLIAGRYYVDYTSGELIKELPYFFRACFLHPFNDRIIYIKPSNFVPTDSNLVIFNTKNDGTIVLNTQDFPTALAVSQDGKYLAIGCLALEPEERTHFYLYDAKTMKLIDEFEDVPSEGRQIEFIQFSETAKYVGYGHLSGGTYKATLFMIDAPNKKWEFSNWKMPGYAMDAVGFINDRYAIVANNSFDTTYTIIYDLNTDKIINNINNYGSFLPLHNNNSNSILFDYFYSHQYDQPIRLLSCFDLVPILSGVDIEDEHNQIETLNISYQKGNLQISNYEPTPESADIKIFDLSGKMFLKIKQPLIQDSLQIKIDMQSGVYILQMQEGDRQYSQKFIISN